MMTDENVIELYIIQYQFTNPFERVFFGHGLSEKLLTMKEQTI